MAKCPSCGATLSVNGAGCARCRAGRVQAGDPVATAPPMELEEPTVASPSFAAMLEAEERGAVPVLRATVGGTVREASVEIAPRFEFASVPGESDPMVRMLVDLTPDGPAYLDPSAGPVAHVILLLDVSASMNHEDKYPVLTDALSDMLHELASPSSADVLVSVVLFAYGAKTILRDVPAKSLSPRDVLARIDSSPLRFGRYTDCAGALARAMKIAHEQRLAQPAMPTRIYLLTDGRPQDLAATREMVQKISKLPVDLHALAFGGDADVGLLQEFVSGGRGGTVKQVRADTLGEAFDRIAEVAQRVVSNRAIVELELGPGVAGSSAFRYRPGRHSFGDDAFTDGTTFRTDLGAFESGRTYSLLFGLRLPETHADVTDVGVLRVRLRGHGGPLVFERAITIPRTAGDTLPEPDGDVVGAADVLAALSSVDSRTQLRALRVRKKLYVAERRDPHVIAVIDRAIRALETEGTLASLSPSEYQTLRSHTCTGGTRPPAARNAFAAG